MDIRSPDVLQSAINCLTSGADSEEELSENVCVAAASILHDHCMWDVFAIMKPKPRKDLIKAAGKLRAQVIELFASMDGSTEAVRMVRPVYTEYRYPSDSRIPIARLCCSAQVVFGALMDVLHLYKRCGREVAAMDFHIPPEVADRIEAWFEKEMDEGEHELEYMKSFCQCVVNGGLPLQKFAPLAVAHFVKHGSDCEQLIKAFTRDLKKKLLKSGPWSTELVPPPPEYRYHISDV